MVKAAEMGAQTTVLERVPLRELPVPRQAGSCFSDPTCSVISASNAVSSTVLVSSVSSPPGPTRSMPCSLTWASSCSASFFVSAASDSPHPRARTAALS